MAKGELTKQQAAIQRMDEAFGQQAKAPDVKPVLQDIKMGKDEYFEFADGTERKEKELTGYIIKMHECRSYFENDFGAGDSGMPDCWSSDGITPDADNPVAANCAVCPNSKWNEEAGEFPCKHQMMVLFLPEDESLAYRMRIRSTSATPKSPIRQFATNCIKGEWKNGKWEGFAAYPSAYQTVKVKLTLDKTKINQFDTSILQVNKVQTLDPQKDEEELTRVIDQFNAIQSVYDQKTYPEAQPVEETNAYQGEPADDIPI